MPDRFPDGPRPGDWVPPPADATREITLPPMPDRPGPAVRPEWASYVPAPQHAPPTVAPHEPGPAAPEAEAGADRPRRPHDLPTDRLAGPLDRARSSTLAFQPPPPVQLLKVSVGPSRRSGRSLWAVAILVPLLIILGSGVWLVVLFYGG